MDWEISNAIVVDDALGPPGLGALHVEDKNAWIDFVSKHATAQNKLLTTFSATKLSDIDELLAELTSDPDHIASLWSHFNDKSLPEARLELLFQTFAFDWTGKAEKPLAVCNALSSFVSPEKIKKFWRMEDAIQAMDDADVAFIDFFLNDNEQPAAALKRIRDHKDHLRKAKLLFFMSSRAAIETQQQVRDIVGVRTAFFETMTKTEIDAAYVIAKIKKKSSAYLGNKSLENVVQSLANATRDAANEFETQCASLEIHDLRLLNLARLANEGESISAYLTWLASESIAAKIRRLCSFKTKKIVIDADTTGVTGQIKQGKVLFELFSDVVFGPGHSHEDPLHFGEVLVSKMQHRRFPNSAALTNRTKSHVTRTLLKRKLTRMKQSEAPDGRKFSLPQVHEPDRYLLVLTPACDLVRCSPSKNVLCVLGFGQDFSDVKSQAREKLYGKHPQGLRHLFNAKGTGSPVLITWQKDQTLMLPLRDLIGGGFRRIAQMNELYAHEVKEEVLRELGRVGTQIDPPPTFALHATIKWNISSNGNNWKEETTERDSFYSAVLTYSEQSKDKVPLVILSDEFKKWAISKITQSLNGQAPHAKLKNCLESLENATQFILKKDMASKGELLVRVANDTNNNLTGFVVDVALSTETL